MDYLPVCLDLRARPCLIVGGNAIAARKAALLQRAQANITVVASRLCPALQALHRSYRLHHVSPPLPPTVLANQHLVIAADDRPAHNRQVAEQARRLGIPVNVVDNAALSSFIMPALIDRSPVLIAITSGGTAPVLVRLLRNRIETLLPEGLGRLARLAGITRASIRKALPNSAARRQFWERFFRSSLATQIMADSNCNFDQAAQQIRHCTSEHRPQGDLEVLTRLPAAADLLTLRAVRVLADADVVVHGPGTPTAILDYTRRDAEFIVAGTEHDLASRVAQRVRQGLRVVWLSSATLENEIAQLNRCGVSYSQQILTTDR